MVELGDSNELVVELGASNELVVDLGDSIMTWCGRVG